MYTVQFRFQAFVSLSQEHDDNDHDGDEDSGEDASKDDS